VFALHSRKPAWLIASAIAGVLELDHPDGEGITE
jgi:hypothetical protein